MKKRGMLGLSTVMEIILALFVFVVLMGVLIVGVQKMRSSVIYELPCKFAVVFSSEFIKQIPVMGKRISYNMIRRACRTDVIEVSGYEAEVEKQIADLMVRCWWMFGKGNIKDIPGVDKFICYNVYIKEIAGRIEPMVSITYLSMMRFLMEKEYKKGVKYWDYIERDSKVPNICFDDEIFGLKGLEESGFGWKKGFKEKSYYYIIFKDNNKKGWDKILVSNNAGFKGEKCVGQELKGVIGRIMEAVREILEKIVNEWVDKEADDREV